MTLLNISLYCIHKRLWARDNLLLHRENFHSGNDFANSFCDYHLFYKNAVFSFARVPT